MITISHAHAYPPPCPPGERLRIAQELVRPCLSSGRNLLAVALAAVGFGTLATVGCDRPEASRIEVFPRHFELRPGETIRYTPLRQSDGEKLQFLEAYGFETGNPLVLQLKDPRGLFRAVAPGTTELVVNGPETQQRYDIEVRGPALPPFEAVPYSEVDALTGKEVLFVGHANRDGFDHTAVAKAGIDRLVAEFKARGSPVVYWVSEEYPDWYTEDRQPDLAIVSEGQEHEILVDVDRVVFTGGDYMVCTLRNAQMALHGVISAGIRDDVHFIFPPEAIWTHDIWGPGAPRPYPAPAALLSSLWAEAGSDLRRYETVVVPFLDRLFTEYPVLDYPPDVPSPELGVLIDGWNVEVAVGDTMRRTYRRADSAKTVLFEFRAS